MHLNLIRERLDAVCPLHRAIVTASDGEQVQLQQTVEKQDLRLGGKVNGPAIMALADVAGYCATLPVLAADEDAVTVSLTMDFLSPCATELLHCNATPIKTGSRLIIIEACVYDDKQALCAKARMIYARIKHNTL